MMALTVHSQEPRSKRRRSQGYIAEHPNDEEEMEGIDLHQQRYPWEGSDMDYLYNEAQAGNICVAAFDSTCSGICRSADPIVEPRSKRRKSQGYIAEHPNDEEEVERIDLHQKRYPWEGSDMHYLYDESSFAQLLSMELTLEINGDKFHVPNANASSNVDSQF
ncbi:hypothetical protein F2Q69_00027733 [Brassica cretica]|uniref:Uncharacterized protein n=1 Tax=Brassica cretica TaxID=69181 RepID=A0A8S9RX18_BRACR|nr:hypothetical protein F2Q69_00027733 [Brassica cretica]